MWIKVLEGHYMTLFQSHDYSQTMARSAGRPQPVSGRRQEVFEDALKLLPVSTYRDMDEVNREIYQLKRPHPNPGEKNCSHRKRIRGCLK